MLKALDCYRMDELGLDTKIPKNGLKMSINPNFISKNLEIDYKNSDLSNLFSKKSHLTLTLTRSCLDDKVEDGNRK